MNWKVSVLFLLWGTLSASAQSSGGGDLSSVIQNSLSAANNYVGGIALGLASVYGVLLWVDQALVGGKTDRIISFAIGFVMIVVSGGITSLILSSGAGS